MKKGSLLLFAAFMLIAGCKDNTTAPSGSSGNALVQMTAAGGASAGSISLGKSSGTLGVLATIDSLTVDSAFVFLKDIAFIPAIDTLHTRDSVHCSSDNDREEHGWMGPRVHFRGPYLVLLRDKQPVQIAIDTIPPGTYNGIRFSIHRLRSMDVFKNPALPDSLVGYSIVIFGSVKYAGATWAPFEYKANIDEEFKVRGNFVVPAGLTIVPYVLNFDLATWFTGPAGRILDPASPADRWLIRWTIKTALGGHVHGGRDMDHNGDPD
jgi:hypothetical protein